MIISIDTKTFDKIQRPFLICLSKLGSERNFLNMIKDVHENPVTTPKIKNKIEIDVYPHHLSSTLYWRF